MEYHRGDARAWLISAAISAGASAVALNEPRSGPAAFELPCYEWERLLHFLSDNCPLALPMQREKQLIRRQNYQVVLPFLRGFCFGATRLFTFSSPRLARITAFLFLPEPLSVFTGKTRWLRGPRLAILKP